MEQHRTSKRHQSGIGKLYLIIFNSVETLGWTFLLFKLLAYFMTVDKRSLYDQIGWPVYIFPGSAVLEIFHATFGLVPSNPIMTAAQVFSRIQILCGVILPSIAAKESVGLCLALFAWSFTEVFRYSFYALNLVTAVPYFLLWLRYSIFIVMYPLGLCGELLLLYAAQEEFGNTGRWSIALPNCLNFAFSYRYFLIINMFGFIGACVMLYTHMLSQRKKVLGVTFTDKKHN